MTESSVPSYSGYQLVLREQGAGPRDLKPRAHSELCSVNSNRNSFLTFPAGPHRPPSTVRPASPPSVLTHLSPSGQTQENSLLYHTCLPKASFCPGGGQLLWLWPLLLHGGGSPLPRGTRSPLSLLLPGKFCCFARGAGGLEAQSLGSSVRRVSGAECFEGADPLLDGGRSPQGWPRALPGGGGRLAGGGHLSPGVRNTIPQTFQALAKPGWLGGYWRTLLHGAAARLLVSFGTAAGGVQLRGSPVWVAPHPIFLTQRGVGLQRHVVVVLTHDGAKEIFDAVRNSNPRVFGCGLKAIVHPSLSPKQWVFYWGRLHLPGLAALLPGWPSERDVVCGPTTGPGWPAAV
ncbi:TPA: hypothetical protein BOS_20191 [Bos taurus]|nr:TPA: hypothetical protein BOS_20191 [Bos taurus]